MAFAALAAFATLGLPGQAQAQVVPPDYSIVSVCSGVSLPRSVVTDILDPVVTEIYDPIETAVNGILGGLTGPLFPSPLSVDVSTLLTDAAAGDNISVSAVAIDGTLVGPTDACNATADSFMLDSPAGIAVGGNQITGLGDPGFTANAGEIDSIAIGNRASTDATALGAVAIGPDAMVGVGAIGGIAIGDGAEVTGNNSVALGAGSTATRDDSVSIGTPGGERQLTNVAAGTTATDAVNLGQLQAATDDAVQYDDSTHTVVTLDGVGGTTLTNLRAGTVSATSTDAINGSQLYGVQQQVDSNTTAITNLQTSTGGNTTAITNLQINVADNSTAITNNSTAITNLRTDVENGAVGPVQYSDPATPTTPNGGTPTNDVTLVGADPGAVGLHNVANGYVGAGSTDAINGGQLYDAVFGAFPNAVSYDDSSHLSVTLNAGGGSTVIHNVAAGTAPTDAVNVQQLNGSMANAVATSNSYTDNRIEDLAFDMRDGFKDARAGTAAALAAAGMPQAMGEGKTMVAGGVGTYRGRVAFAVGASHRASNGQSLFRLGVTYDSSSHVGANAGAGFEF